MRYLILLLLVTLVGCHQSQNYLLKVNDTVKDASGYVNLKGDTVIPLGKYPMCFTDTFKNYAIVLKTHEGLVGIDRSEKVLFKVFPFDNGPDYPSDGYFRIVENGKLGYADVDGHIKIKPQFGCAFPFVNGLAKVAMDCTTKPVGSEHWVWESNNWFYINKAGVKVHN